MATNNAINVGTAASNTILQGQGVGTAPAFSTATFPATTTINQILYSSSANAVTGLATANSATLNTNGSGVPSITADPTFGTLTLSEATHAMLNCQDTSAGSTTAGPVCDLYRNTTGAATNVIGQITYSGQNASSSKVTFGSHTVTIDTATAGAEDSSWRLATLQAGASKNQIIALKTGCQIRGNNTNTAAPAGYFGEILSNNLAQGSAIALTNNVISDIVQLSITPGNWIVFVIAGFTGAVTTGTQTFATVTTTSGSAGTPGVNLVATPTVSTTGADLVLCIPAWPQSVSTTTTYFYSVRCKFTVGSCSAYGTLGAIRVG